MATHKDEEPCYYCICCGEHHGLAEDKLLSFRIHGETKRICKECADTIHGLM